MVNEVLPKKRITVDLVLAIIFLAVFLIMLLLNIILLNLLNFRYIHTFLLALLLVPSGIFYLIMRYHRKHKVSKTKRIVIRTICIVVSVAFLFFNVVGTIFGEFIIPVRNPIYYQHLLSMYDYPHNEQMAHFPKAVPPGARNVKFYEQPEFLQGGSDFILTYDTDSKEINRIYDTYSSQALIVIKGDTTDMLSDDDRIPQFTYDQTGYEGLPQDFDYIVLGAKPYHPGDWNHGYTYGVAISRERREVIFWSEYW